MNGKSVFLSADFLIVLRSLTAKTTRVEIYEVNPVILAGAAYSHDVSTLLPKKGCDWRRHLTPTIQDRLDVLKFIQEVNSKGRNGDTLS